MGSCSMLLTCIGTVTLLRPSPRVVAAQDIETHRVQFAHGTSSTTVRGTIKGSQTIDYLVGARKGQVMNVSLATKHGATYFNLIAPGQTDVAFHIGPTVGNQFEGPLPASGDYRVRVYMMRSAARRNETASYRLEISITGAGDAAGRSTDAKVPGTEFHATGMLPCSMGGGQPTTQCKFGVRREGSGSGTVTITRPDGRTRTIIFTKGRATGYDQSQADSAPLQATREGDLTIVRIGSERYEIPDAVIEGG